MKVEILPHAADMGLVISAKTLREAFKTSALAVSSLLVPSEPRPTSMRTIEVKAADRGSLLVNFLNEIIFLFEVHKFVISDVRISALGRKNLKAEIFGERFSPKRHQKGISVKAATYHKLEIKKEGRRWKIKVIFDV